MKRKTASILFLIALLVVGPNTAVPVVTAAPGNDLLQEDQVSDENDDDSDDNNAPIGTQNQDAQNSATASTAATSASLGSIQIGPSASGEAVRILSTAYTLQPLSGDVCLSCIGVIVGPADLFTPRIIDQLRAAYEAGHAVGLTNATQASIERLHDLLQHHGSVQLVPGGAEVDLVVFRKAQRPDGQFNFSSHVLFPRAASTTGVLTKEDKQRLKRVSKSLRRKLRRKLVNLRTSQQQETADRADIQALNRVFSATPELPASPPPGSCDDQENIYCLAESYQSHPIKTDQSGNQVQIVDTVWAARSFLDSQDLYYVLQEADFHIINPLNGFGLLFWSNSTASFPFEPNPTLLQPSPQTTMEATQYISSVQKSISGSVGWNQAQGLNASVSGGVSITNSQTTTIPPINITFNSNLATGHTFWNYYVNELPQETETITTYQGWIWEIPFSNYQLGQTEFQFSSWAQLQGTWHGFPPSFTQKVSPTANLTMSVPMPFGRTFALQPPTVTGVSPSCVNSGDQFTIQGTGFYPSLVQSVLIGGTPVSADNITRESDTQLKVVAPDTIECHGTGCPVAVQTTQGTSNTNFNIVISDFCN